MATCRSIDQFGIYSVKYRIFFLMAIPLSLYSQAWILHVAPLLYPQEIDLHHHKAETLRQSIEDLREKIRYLTIMIIATLCDPIFLLLCSQLKVEIEVDKARTRPLVLLEK